VLWIGSFWTKKSKVKTILPEKIIFVGTYVFGQDLGPDSEQFRFHITAVVSFYVNNSTLNCLTSIHKVFHISFFYLLLSYVQFSIDKVPVPYIFGFLVPVLKNKRLYTGKIIFASKIFISLFRLYPLSPASSKLLQKRSLHQAAPPLLLSPSPAPPLLLSPSPAATAKVLHPSPPGPWSQPPSSSQLQTKRDIEVFTFKNSAVRV
jgi:hypothetical protein